MTREALKNLRFEVEILLREAWDNRDAKAIAKHSRTIAKINHLLATMLDTPVWRKQYESVL